MRLAHKQTGSSLLEMLAALSMLSIGILGVMILMTRSITLARDDLEARRMTRIVADLGELEALQSHVTPELHQALDATRREILATHSGHSR